MVIGDAKLERHALSTRVINPKAMIRLLASLPLLLTAVGCAVLPESPQQVAIKQEISDEAIVPFSANSHGGSPRSWEPLVILPNKKKTQYRLVSVDNTTVLHAHAEKSSSGLMQKLSVEPSQQPWLHWDWKVGGLITAADNTLRGAEDSPVRIILGFDGDKESLPFSDQLLFETAKAVTGQDFPYATLMYIWENKLPVGTVIRSSHSSRIRMIVAARGSDGIGEWRNFARNIVQDFERAFGEKPGKLIGIGVLSDTDNTGETVESWYGDIRLLKERSSLAVLSDLDRRPLPLSQSE